MNEIEFRKKFERNEENPRGINSNVINNIIRFIDSSKESSDENVKYFLENFDNMDKVFENFIIFESDVNNGFMSTFKALILTVSADNLIIGHEVGHILNSIKNVRFVDPGRSLTIKIDTPENFEEILGNAKDNCLLPENKEFFKEYIQHLCKDSDISEAEKSISDIISAIFRQPALRIGSYDNICIFPATHRAFFDESIPENEKLGTIFDECFANIFSLKANNQEKELEILKHLLGDEFIKMYDSEIQQSLQIFRNEVEPDKSLSVKKLGKETVGELKDIEFITKSEQFLKKERETKQK